MRSITDLPNLLRKAAGKVDPTDPEYTVSVTTADDQTVGTIFVESDTVLEINAFNWRPRRPFAGDAYVAMVVIENTGTAGVTRTIEYAVDGQVIETDVVAIDGESAARIEFRHSIDEADVYAHGVDVDDLTQERTIEIREAHRGGRHRR